jgi:hypothetical protein
MIPSAFENLAEHLARGFANRYLGTSFGPTPVARYMGSDDMQALRAVVRKALTEGRNTIGVGRGGDTGVYADYAALGAGGGAGLTGMTSTRASNTNAPSFWERITQITASPITNVAMTVGAAKIVKEGDRVYIEDRYDFDPRTTSKPYVDRLRRGESMRSVLADVAMDQGLGMYGKIRTIAALANDDIGEGSDRVYLGTVDEIMAGASGSDTFRKAPNPFSVSGEPDPDLVARRMQREGETKEQATTWLRSEWSRRQHPTHEDMGGASTGAVPIPRVNPTREDMGGAIAGAVVPIPRERPADMTQLTDDAPDTFTNSMGSSAGLRLYRGDTAGGPPVPRPNPTREDMGGASTGMVPVPRLDPTREDMGGASTGMVPVPRLDPTREDMGGASTGMVPVPRLNSTRKDRYMLPTFRPLPSYQMGGAIGPGGQPMRPAGLQDAAPTGEQMSPQMVEMQIEEFVRTNPQAVQQIQQLFMQGVQSGQLDQQELNNIYQLAMTALRNPATYPQLRQYAITQGIAAAEDLPPQFDQPLVIAVILAIRSAQAGVGGQNMMQGGTPAMAPPAPALGAPPPGGAMPSMAKGGPIPGGSGSKPVAIEAHEGEYVIPKHVVDMKGREFFDKMLAQYGPDGKNADRTSNP